MRYVIIGLGTFGSYLYERLKVHNPQCEVIIVNHRPNANKVDIDSQFDRLKISKGYMHLGPGGLSKIWGGNLVLMTRKQFLSSSISERMAYESYVKHSQKVFSYFKLAPNSFVQRNNYVIQETSWLKIRKRKIVATLRKCDKYYETSNWSFSNTEENEVIVEGRKFYYDRAFVCCGALENMRILNRLDKRLFTNRKFFYRDHVSFDYEISGVSLNNTLQEEITHEVNWDR